ncbi:hypothetical protein BJX65DRAFT_305423 [Aspergillus insuetus]
MALFRLACVRLHYNLCPYFRLDTRDPWIIAQAIREALLPDQSVDFRVAVLQSAHTLNISARRWGDSSSATTQAVATWTVMDAVCHAECTYFLSKWLERTVAYSGSLLSRGRDHQLVDIVAALVARSNPGADFLTDSDNSRKIKAMAVQVVRDSARVLRYSHVFDIEHVLCASLNTYAVLLENTI